MTKKLLLILTTTLVLVSCNQQNLFVQSEYVTYEDLASFHVGTPDPKKECPDTGQRLIARWSLPRRSFVAGHSTFTLHIRYGNGEEKIITRDLEGCEGRFIYDLLNEDYFCKGGILTYKAYLTVCDNIVEEWFHQIWTERIEFDDDSTS